MKDQSIIDRMVRERIVELVCRPEPKLLQLDEGIETLIIGKDSPDMDTGRRVEHDS